MSGVGLIICEEIAKIILRIKIGFLMINKMK